jgi:hypothetical protein
MDIDYHWPGDLDQKQAELIKALKRRLVPFISRKFGHQGDVRAATGPEAESPSVRIVDLAFWRPDVAYGRIDIPIEITRIICADPTTVRTADGVVYPTPSDMDVIEGKVTALFNRPFLQHRDLLDIFLFSSHLGPASPRRLKDKFNALSIHGPKIRKILDDFESNTAYHVRALNEVITTQVDPEAAANIRAGGGTEQVFQTVRDLVNDLLKDQP